MIDYARFARAIILKETCLNGYIVSTHPTVLASNHNLPNQTKIHEWSDYRCGKSVRVRAVLFLKLDFVLENEMDHLLSESVLRVTHVRIILSAFNLRTMKISEYIGSAV